MNCEQCGLGTSEWFTYVPIKHKDGKLNTYLCRVCASVSKAYCTIHSVPHIGFEDGSTACKKCIDMLATSLKEFSEKWMSDLLPILPFEDKRKLQEYIIGNSLLTGNDYNLIFALFIASKANRSGLNFEEVVEKLFKEKSTKFIFI